MVMAEAIFRMMLLLLATTDDDDDDDGNWDDSNCGEDNIHYKGNADNIIDLTVEI